MEKKEAAHQEIAFSTFFFPGDDRAETLAGPIAPAGVSNHVICLETGTGL